MNRGADGRPLRRALVVVACGLLVLTACGRDMRETTDARPVNEPPAAAPSVAASEVPPTLQPQPLWKAPFSSAPKPTDNGYVGPVMPTEDQPDLRFLGVGADGTTHWSTPRNPSCTAFTVTRPDGRELVVLLDSDAAPDRGLAATRTTAAAYTPDDGTKVWGPVEVPGTMIGPGLIFGATPHTIMSDDSGPKLALRAATGDAAADEQDGGGVLHEHDGTLLVRADGRLQATDTATGRNLWSSDELPVPDDLASTPVSVAYGPRPTNDTSGTVILEWRSSASGDALAYSVHDLDTGTRLAWLSPEREPVLLGAPRGNIAVVSGHRETAGTQQSGDILMAFATGGEPRLLWSRGHGPDAPRPKRIVDDVLYLATGSGPRAIAMDDGRTLGAGPWPAPVAASGGRALHPVEAPGPGETFVALPTAGVSLMPATHPILWNIENIPPRIGVEVRTLNRRDEARPGLGPLESAVLEALWEAGGRLSVREVIAALPDRDPAYTTISTVLENLRRKEWVDREQIGRLWFYHALHDRTDYAARLMHGALTDSGDARATLLRFVDDMAEQDVDMLRALLTEVPRQEEKP